MASCKSVEQSVLFCLLLYSYYYFRLNLRLMLLQRLIVLTIYRSEKVVDGFFQVH